MSDKKKYVILIDDDEATNFYNKMIIEQTGCDVQVVSLETAQEALDYLQDAGTAKRPFPDYIFLDLNMPGMNGWDFLKEYKKIPLSKRKKSHIYILTTSTNPEDKEKAKQIKNVEGFKRKPLNLPKLQSICQSYPESR